MLRRQKRRTPQQRAWLRVKQRAPQGIGLTRRQIKAAKDEAEDQQIRKTHDKVWARDATCRYCEGRRWANRDEDQMHEDPPRSATRNLPPQQRFNSRGSGRACPRCHEDLTGTIGRKMTTRFLSDRGFDGPLEGVMRPMSDSTDAPVITEQEWRRRYIQRLIDVAHLTEAQAESDFAAVPFAEHVEGYEDDPEGAADMEMSYWSE